MNQFYMGYFLLLHGRALCTFPFIFHMRTATPFNLSPGLQNALRMQRPGGNTETSLPWHRGRYVVCLPRNFGHVCWNSWKKINERFLVEALTSLSHGNRRAGSKTRDRSRRSLQRPASPNSGSHGFVCWITAVLIADILSLMYFYTHYHSNQIPQNI